ncbi:MAG: YfhO family protein [Bacteroidota bacterium]
MQLQFSKKSRWQNKWCYLFLLGVCFIGFWPIAFGIFSVKNDAIQYFLPFRYNISSAIQDGSLPLWSPFIYLGYPLHGDMQSGAWNPFVWIISLFARYDLTLFHIEYLLYIFLSGVGMFQLSRLMTDKPGIKLLAATAYMLSGYMFGSGQFINWIASAAFIPFIIHYYYQFLSSGKRSSAIITAIFCWLLLVCGYPADVIYLFYILLAMLLAGAWHKRKELRNRAYWKMFAGNYLLLILVFLGLSAPALISYVELLPYYTRGTGASYTESIQNAYELKNAVSFLNPWPAWSEDFNSITDPTGRNIFAGICVVCLFIFSLFYRWDKVTKFLLALLLFSFLFSLGDGFLVRKAAYYLLPGMNSFRHPSHFRLYVLLPIILLSCRGLYYITTRALPVRYFNLICFTFLAICLVMAISSYSPLVARIFTHLPGFNGTQLKQWLSSFSKGTLLFSGFAIQSIFLLLLIFLIKRKKVSIKAILFLHLANLFVFQVLFPVNFVSKTNPAVINKIIHAAPVNYDTNTSGQSLLDNSQDAFQYFENVGLYYFYNKKIGISKISNSPSFLSGMNEFLENDSVYNYVAQKPVAYLSDSINLSTGKINNITIDWNRIDLETESGIKVNLHLTQNYHHNWMAKVDGKPVTISKANIAFMSLPLEPGRHSVRFTYKPQPVYSGMIIFCITIVCLILSLFFYTSIKKQP